MESAGARLKKIRLERGITLEEVHKKTNIHLNILNAIEEDRLVNLNPVYVKGFLKIYCRFLGLDHKDFISDYKDYKSPESEEKKVSPSEGKEKTAALFKNTSEKIVPFSPKIKFKTIFLSAAAVIAVFLFYSLGKGISSGLKARSLSKKKESPVVAAVSGKENGLKEKNKAEKTQAKPSVLRLGIRTKDSSWISVKADGRVIFQGVLKKGRYETWQAKDKIELSLGNAGAVMLEVNGKDISSVGRNGQTIKNIVITKDGLEVPR